MGVFDWIKRHRWELALVDKDWNLHFIKSPYKNRWFADPFILTVTDEEIILLVEEFSYRIKKGRIARLAVDRGLLTIAKMEIILELDTHLSFPFIMRKGNDIYICPENSASGSSTMYRYNDETRGISPCAINCKLPLTDAVFLRIQDNSYIFSTSIPDPNGKTLTIYRKDTPGGAYIPVQTVQFSDYVARNAGAIMERNGQLLRPAQICDGGYGYGLGIEFQRISYDNGLFSFSVAEQHFPPRGYDGLHTYNEHAGVAIVDCRCFNHPALRGMLHFVKGLVKR